ncbi:MAG: hypothetical protein HYU74_00930 [Dechloromonas sp.]|nr:hypothetical protein [Dechloromonas sp.]
MARLLAWLAGTLLVLGLAAGGLFFAALDRQALVSRSETISPNSVAQARGLLLTNDPRRLRSGEARRTAIPAALIDDGINYLATRFLRGRGALALDDGGAEIRLTVRAPLLPADHFLNFRATLRESDGQPRITSARLGRLPLPVWLLEPAFEAGIRQAGYDREWRLARQAFQEVRFEPERRQIVVAYRWQPALLEHARALAVTADELVRLRAAHEMLAALVAAQPPGSRLPLTTLLAPLLASDGNEQLAKRRAAIFVLAAYLSEKKLASFIPEAASWPKARPTLPTLFGRVDSAQHFVISAALAAWAGEPIADAIGVYKELIDARQGSGFSFADLAADRAGTAFGELLIKQPARLDRLLEKPIADADLLPALTDFPEAMGERDFRRRFGAPGSPAYQQLTSEIERRLFALPLYQGLGKS